MHRPYHGQAFKRELNYCTSHIYQPTMNNRVGEQWKLVEKLNSIFKSLFFYLIYLHHELYCRSSTVANFDINDDCLSEPFKGFVKSYNPFWKLSQQNAIIWLRCATASILSTMSIALFDSFVSEYCYWYPSD